MKKFILPVIAIAVAAVAAVIIAVSVGGKEEVYRLIKVNSFEGEVAVWREENIDVFNGLQLISEDEVEVGDESLLELLADSDKHIVAEANTAFVLNSTGTEKSGSITIDLLYGSSLIAIDNKLPEGSEFVVNTPNAALSVRGTVFYVTYDPETETTTLEVTEGVVEVVSADGEQYIEAGDACVVGYDSYYEDDVITELITEDTDEETTSVDEFEDPLAAGRFNLKTDETESGRRYHVYVPSGFTVKEPFLKSFLRDLKYDELTGVTLHRENGDSNGITILVQDHMGAFLEMIREGSYTGSAYLSTPGELSTGAITTYNKTVDKYQCRINDTDKADVYIIETTYETGRAFTDYMVFIDMVTNYESDEELHPVSAVIQGEYIDDLLGSEYSNIGALIRAIFPPA